MLIAGCLEAIAQYADIIFTSLGNDESVVGVYGQMLSAHGAEFEGKLFVETSTILPATTEKIAAMVREKGGAFVAGPVFGAPAMAEQGKLVWVMAGLGADIEKVKPYADGV